MLPRILKFFAVFVAIIGIQFIIYVFVFHPLIIRWGASDTETTMKMPGDNQAEVISSTRAISIAVSRAKVWDFLVGMGADRKGFYSFTFLEKMFGSEIKDKKSKRKYDLKVGRLVPATSPNAEGKYTVGFYVTEVDPEKSLVLKGWGSFVLKARDKHHTRLIVRTHSRKPANIIEKGENLVFDMVHFIMEKKMLLEIKKQAELGMTDRIFDLDWIVCVFLSGIIGIVLIAITKGYLKWLLPTLFFLLWQWVFMILPLMFMYPMGLFIVTYKLIVYFRKWAKKT